MRPKIREPRRFRDLANPDYAAPPFVHFEKVNTSTRLESLNLNWRERDLPERERTKHVHRLHPYLGKFVPQLVEIFLRKFEPDIVCDPFTGCGTTLVEALALGIDSVGCDIAPFNCLLTKVKTDEYEVGLLRKEIADILARSATRGGLFRGGAAPFSDTEVVRNGYIHDWYAEPARNELLTFCSLIPNYDHQDVMKVILSRAARSARLTTHHELDFPRKPQRGPYHCRKHKRTCSPTKDARKFLVRYAWDTVKRVEKFALIRKDARVRIICGDSRYQVFPSVDMVITSPPYVGLIDYHEQHRYAYEFLSLLPEPFKSVGWEKAKLMADAVSEIGPASEGQSEQARKIYRSNIVAALGNLARRMVPGGRMVIVIGDRHGLYEDMASELGLEPEAKLERHVNRRTGRRNSAFFESVLIWRKS